VTEHNITYQPVGDRVKAACSCGRWDSGYPRSESGARQGAAAHIRIASGTQRRRGYVERTNTPVAFNDPGLGVMVRTDPDGTVDLRLGDLAARRLILGLGVNTKRYGPEVTAILAALCRQKLGIMPGAIDQTSPHGYGCWCINCKIIFPKEEQQ
jgi:hypothetical protein